IYSSYYTSGYCSRVRFDDSRGHSTLRYCNRLYCRSAEPDKYRSCTDDCRDTYIFRSRIPVDFIYYCSVHYSIVYNEICKKSKGKIGNKVRIKKKCLKKLKGIIHRLTLNGGSGGASGWRSIRCNCFFWRNDLGCNLPRLVYYWDVKAVY